MIITKVWAMPNRHTFLIKPIKELIARYHIQPTSWVDPFCGHHSPAESTNDLNPDVLATAHLDALDYLSETNLEIFDGGFYDPPYSMRQASECYKSVGKEKQTNTVTSMKYWSRCKDELARVIKPNGICICCGWNSNGLGKSRGFEMIEILLVAHGGQRNDTIVTVEKNNNGKGD